ncbi:RNH1 Ribonuclease, partial [Hirundo rustica]|nr:RNH1 Ribonuclease [Hirundo rustica]
MLRWLMAVLSHSCFVRRGGSMFYAVRTGRRTGVYRTWAECQEQVNKFPSASFKKFASEKDAWSFVRAGLPEPQQQAARAGSASGRTGRRAGGRPAGGSVQARRHCQRCGCCRNAGTTPFRSSSLAQLRGDGLRTWRWMCQRSGSVSGGDFAVVYTDGCCTGNGHNRARAGIGVYWGPGHPLNTSERLPGRQTNQRAEIHAACKAIEQAKSQNIKKLIIYTDSKFTIKGITGWVDNWKTNGWRTSSGGSVINKEDFERLDNLAKDMEIQWMHIPGHAGFRGNEEADRLAREGARKQKC